MPANINSVVLVGNLTRDPELRHTPSGMAVCSLRLAVNSRRKDESGNWADKPNYFDITVWGAQGENCAQYLAKGRPVGVQGRLEWREWDAQDGTKRQAVEVVADNVQFLGSRDGGGEGGGTWAGQDAWGRRKLAYEINKKSDGVYHLLSFSADGDTLDEIARVLKIDDDVMRHLATRRYKPGSTQPVAVGGPAREDVAEPIDSSLEEE